MTSTAKWIARLSVMTWIFVMVFMMMEEAFGK